MRRHSVGPHAREYFRRDGGVVHWWKPERSIMAEVYGRELNYIERLIQLSSPRNLLEVSCGYGRVLKRLQGSVKTTGLDISLEMLKLATHEVPMAKFINAEAENLPFLADSFDCVVCTMSLVHYENPIRVLHEIFRVLQPGGTIVIDIDNRYSIRRAVKLINNLAAHAISSEFVPRGTGIFAPYSPRIFSKLVKDAEFDIETIKYCGLMVPINVSLGFRWKIPVIPKWLAKIALPLDEIMEDIPVIQKLATYIIILAKKQKIDAK